jgi:plasmid segregation protein ParM
MEMFMGIDAGNNETKVCTMHGCHKFPSDLGEYRDRNLVQSFSDDDMIWEYEGRKGFAGTLAKFESEFGESMRGDTKAHFDAKLRVLLAIHRYSNETEHNLVVGQPIGRHTPDEKKKIKDMLMGRHELTVNGVRKVFVIRKCEVAAEGATAGLLNPSKGIVRVIDIGSGTVNFGTVHDMRFVDRDSFTVSYGMNTVKNLQPEAMARMIAIKALNKWSKEDTVRLCGGGAFALYNPMKEYFPNVEIIPDPVFANAKAFYEIARKVYA